MTPTDADTLAKRIINTWRGGPPLRDWTEVLTPLDAGRAGTAYARLRARNDHPPSIAQYIAEYNQLDTARPGEHDPCGDCNSTGWIDAPDRHWPEGRTSTQMKPCPYCDEGRARAASRIWTERHPLTKPNTPPPPNRRAKDTDL